MACKHCGKQGMRESTLDRLEVLRRAYNKPMHIPSAYRCADHPIEKKKVEPGSHSHGCAVDVAVQGADAFRLIRLAIEYGFTGIGVSQRAGQPRFIHIDDAATSEFGLARPNVWSY